MKQVSRGGPKPFKSSLSVKKPAIERDGCRLSDAYLRKPSYFRGPSS